MSKTAVPSPPVQRQQPHHLRHHWRALQLAGGVPPPRVGAGQPPDPGHSRLRPLPQPVAHAGALPTERSVSRLTWRRPTLASPRKHDSATGNWNWYQHSRPPCSKTSSCGTWR